MVIERLGLSAASMRPSYTRVFYGMVPQLAFHRFVGFPMNLNNWLKGRKNSITEFGFA